MDENKELLIKKWHLYLGLILSLIGFLANFALAVGWKTETEISIADHHKRIASLELQQFTNHDVLLEIRYNLQSLMTAQGMQYHKIGN